MGPRCATTAIPGTQAYASIAPQRLDDRAALCIERVDGRLREAACGNGLAELRNDDRSAAEARTTETERSRSPFSRRSGPGSKRLKAASRNHPESQQASVKPHE